MDTFAQLSLSSLKMRLAGKGYIDDSLLLTDQLQAILLPQKQVKLDIFLLIYVAEGELKLDVSNVSHTLRQHDLLVCLPNQLIGNVLATLNHRVQLIGLSGLFVHRHLQTLADTHDVVENLRQHPIRHFASKEERQHFVQYVDWLYTKARCLPAPHCTEVMQHLAAAFFLELAWKTAQDAQAATLSAGHGKGRVGQAEYVLRSFMEEVTADNGHHRTIDYYARRLCYTPKYLSAIVKQATGRNALSIIHEFAMECITSEVRLSDKSIQEIAYTFDFTNVSFFAKFFKRHTGLSPSVYRQRAKEELAAQQMKA